ncbi:Tn3 family transposase [Streptomyces sp. H27-H1]|uniref:Tn3 family transposase n=1 Tax=Streptomyces sp. H27-H1 TaxID=2996461 RepID=UPI002270FEAE|nr:Tn3 family transposase [Streptomyces sp. H27-H1]MCY0932132.1 Tn3 family transposase [Streptomyces sp. H27-H1]
MGRDLGLDGVVDHFTLSGDEAGWLRNKTGSTRLGFAVQLKFLIWRGRFPKIRLELPPDAVEHVAKQVGVAATELGFYDFISRAAKRHRSELRDLTGWHECTTTDQVKLVSQLVDVIWHDERREEQVRAELMRQMREDLIEPPTAAQINAVIRSALHQADERAVAEVAARLAREEDCPGRLDALVFTDPTDDHAAQGDTAEGDGGDSAEDDEDDVESVLSDIKSHPGNVSLNSLLEEISKLKQVRAVGIPAKAFAGIGVQVINAWRARASASSPSHLRRFDAPVRHVLLAALLFQRQREITDTLVELLNSTVHRINARAEKKVTEAFVAEFTKVRGKSGLLGKIAAASLGAPDGSVRSVVFPAAGGEKTLKDLVAEMKATNAEFARNKREVFKSSYSNHYRSGLMKLLSVLDFCSSNDQHKPVMVALKLIERHKDSSTTYLPLGETIPLDGVVRKDWMEFAIFTPDKGPKRVMRTVYEACVFQALRDRLRCKEIWVVGADKWRNPDDDLPDDFEVRRAEYYEKLNKPRDGKVFTAQLQAEMRAELGALDTKLPKLPWVTISGKHRNGAIKFTDPEPQKEPKNLRKLKKAIRKKWGTVALIDILKEAALRTGMLKAMAPIGTREAIDEAKLLERLLLIAYAYGTNSGISSVASGEHKHTEEELRYTARRYLTAVGLKAAGVEIANATFAARSETVWGQGTTTVASDSTHFKAWDRNIFTEWHSRYGGRGVLVYWHIEKGSMAIHSQLLNCTASEVAAAIEGMMRHATTMQAEGNYVDSHGQSEIGFGLTRLLGYDLLPRIKQINKVKLYRPGREDEDSHERLADATTRPIRWDVIENNYDQLIKYATAIRVGTASTEAILRRFTRTASHPVYQAMLEVGKAQKTIFVARYLRDRDLQREIQEGLNVVEGWNGANDIIFFGKSGDLSSNRRDQQELSVLALHLLQTALVFVNTLMIQDMLADPEWADLLTDEDKRALTPLFWMHIQPYGEVRLNMGSRLQLAQPVPQEPEPEPAAA